MREQGDFIPITKQAIEKTMNVGLLLQSETAPTIPLDEMIDNAERHAGLPVTNLKDERPPWGALETFPSASSGWSTSAADVGSAKPAITMPSLLQSCSSTILQILRGEGLNCPSLFDEKPYMEKEYDPNSREPYW